MERPLVLLLAATLLVACNRKKENDAVPSQVTLPARPAAEAPVPSTSIAADVPSGVESAAASATSAAAGVAVAEAPAAQGAGAAAAPEPLEPAPAEAEPPPAEDPPPPAAVLRKQRSTLARCRDEACLFEHIPIASPPTFHAKACAVLETRKPSPRDGFDDLALVCRMRIARARASFREQSPCGGEDQGNPDFDSSLREDARMQLYADLLSAKHLKARGLTPSLAGGGGSFTLHDTHIYRVDLSTYEEKVEAHAFFCISGEPKHYVPYFFSFKQEPRQKGATTQRHEVIAEYVDRLPVRPPHVLFQLGDINMFKTARYELADVDGDRIADLVLLDERWNDPRYPLRVCLFTPQAEQCRMLEVDTRLEPPEPQMTQLELAIDQGRITTRLVGPEGGAPLATAEYQVREGELQRLGAP